MSRDKIWAGNLVKVVSVNVLRLQNYFVYLLGAGVWCAQVRKNTKSTFGDALLSLQR